MRRPKTGIADILDALESTSRSPLTFTQEQIDAAETAVDKVRLCLRLIDIDLAKVGLRCRFELAVVKKLH